MKYYLYISFIFCGLLYSFSGVAQVTDYSGKSIVLSDNLKKSTYEIIIGREISTGDIIRSFDDSSCEILFNDKSTFIKMDSNSEIRIIDKGYKREIHVNKGSIFINSSELNSIKEYAYSKNAQIIISDTKVWISNMSNSIDKIVTVGDVFEISNKYSGKRVYTNELNIFEVSRNDIIMYDSFMLDKESNPDIPDYVFNYYNTPNLSDYISDEYTLKFDRTATDLIPLYSSRESSNSKINFGLDFAFGSANINNDNYYKILISPTLQIGRLELSINFDEYIRVKDLARNINDWSNPYMYSSKLNQLVLSSNDNKSFIKVGNFNNITFGQGNLLNKYSNSFNSPVSQNTGVHLHWKILEKFITIDAFASDFQNMSNGGGLIGTYTTLYLSDHFPLKIGFGYLTDYNQFSKYSDNSILEGINKSIEANEIDFNYRLHNNNNISIDLVGECDLIWYQDSLTYIRDEGNLDEAVKKRSGSWGSLLGLELDYKNNSTLGLNLHYNSALFIPEFFSSSYDLENISLISNSDIPIGNESLISENSEMLRKYQDGDNDSDYFLPKDLAFILTNEYYIHPTYGFSGKYIYNYFDKIGFSFNAMFLSDLIKNNTSTIYPKNNYYSFKINFFMKKRMLSFINEIHFYVYKDYTKISNDSNILEDIYNYSTNDMIAGLFVNIDLTSELDLYLKLENMSSDYNNDFVVENIPNTYMEIRYNMIK